MSEFVGTWLALVVIDSKDMDGWVRTGFSSFDFEDLPAIIKDCQPALKEDRLPDFSSMIFLL